MNASSVTSNHSQVETVQKHLTVTASHWKYRIFELCFR